MQTHAYIQNDYGAGIHNSRQHDDKDLTANIQDTKLNMLQTLI